MCNLGLKFKGGKSPPPRVPYPFQALSTLMEHKCSVTILLKKITVQVITFDVVVVSTDVDVE